MKISHRELEVCIRDPGHWVRTKLEPSRSGPRPGYDAVLKLGIHHLHKGNSLESARRYVEASFERSERLRNGARILDVIYRLESYAAWLEASGTIVADSRARVAMAIGFLELSGIVDRIDITLSGHRGVLFGAGNPGWEQELRMPLLQGVLARLYGVPSSEVAVGVQQLDGSVLSVRTYTGAEIDGANHTMQTLATRVDQVRRSIVRGND